MCFRAAGPAKPPHGGTLGEVAAGTAAAGRQELHVHARTCPLRSPVQPGRAHEALTGDTYLGFVGLGRTPTLWFLVGGVLYGSLPVESGQVG